MVRSFVRFVLSLLKIHINRIIPTGSQRSTRCDLHQCLLVSFVMRKYTYVREREKWRDGDNDSAAVLRYTEENIYKSARDFCQWENLPANGAKIVRNNETLRTHKICGRSQSKRPVRHSSKLVEFLLRSDGNDWHCSVLLCAWDVTPPKTVVESYTSKRTCQSSKNKYNLCAQMFISYVRVYSVESYEQSQ